MEREAFLRRVAEAGAAPVIPDSPDEAPGLLVPDLPDVDLVAAFTENLVAVDGAVHDGVDPMATVLELACNHDRFVSWDDEYIGLPGVVDRLHEAGLERVATDVAPGSTGERHAHQSTVTFGVTGAEAGFAESGSVVLRSGPGRPRAASLVPLIHVVVLRREHLYRSLAHWAAAHADAIPAAANVAVITGPSRTADIEQTLTLGIHGPRELHVVLL